MMKQSKLRTYLISIYCELRFKLKILEFVDEIDVYVGPHFGTVPVPALVLQFRNWNT
jgi:hypothetical protein